jgi:hypothetical protein
MTQEVQVILTLEVDATQTRAQIKVCSRVSRNTQYYILTPQQNDVQQC